jgi:hypothetical protein
VALVYGVEKSWNDLASFRCGDYFGLNSLVGLYDVFLLHIRYHLFAAL